jgi:uncharacterized membrane protein
MEKIERSLAKAISWRIIGTLDTVIIAYFLTDNFKIAVSIGGVEVVSKLILYVGHERAWNHINWSRR